MVMPFCRLVIILVMPSARYSHVSVILSRSGPLGIPSDGLAVVVMELPGAILEGGVATASRNAVMSGESAEMRKGARADLRLMLLVQYVERCGNGNVGVCLMWWFSECGASERVDDRVTMSTASNRVRCEYGRRTTGPDGFHPSQLDRDAVELPK